MQEKEGHNFKIFKVYSENEVTNNENWVFMLPFKTFVTHDEKIVLKMREMLVTIWL